MLISIAREHPLLISALLFRGAILAMLLSPISLLMLARRVAHFRLSSVAFRLELFAVVSLLEDRST